MLFLLKPVYCTTNGRICQEVFEIFLLYGKNTRRDDLPPYDVSLLFAYKLVVFAALGVVRMEQLMSLVSARFARMVMIHAWTCFCSNILFFTSNAVTSALVLQTNSQIYDIINS